MYRWFLGKHVFYENYKLHYFQQKCMFTINLIPYNVNIDGKAVNIGVQRVNYSLNIV
jgi:hypothetical protein